MSRNIHFTKGTYYIGDLCYVMGDVWTDVCDIIIDGRDCLNGQFNLSNKVRFAIYSTKWGDGLYPDNSGRKYSVDSGSIGCINVIDLDPDVMKRAEELGHIVEFTEGFVTSSDEDGLITFGHVIINTDPSDYYAEEEE
jgi:hypothetical protein